MKKWFGVALVVAAAVLVGANMQKETYFFQPQWLLDNIAFNLGTDGDFWWQYDETTDDRIEMFDGDDNAIATVADTGTAATLTWTGTIAATTIDPTNELADADVSNTLTASKLVGSGSTTDAVDLATAEVAGELADANVSNTLQASLFVGSGSTTNAIDLATAEVAGTLPAASVGTGLTDAQVSNTLTASIVVGSGSTTNAVDLATAEVAGTLPDANVADDLTITTTKRIVTSTVTTFTANDTTPSVAAGNIFVVPATWTAGNNITTFDDGVEGQTITIHGGDADCDVVPGATVKTNIAATWDGASGAIIIFQKIGTEWRELLRTTVSSGP